MSELEASITPVREYFLQLQAQLCDDFEQGDGVGRFSIESIKGEAAALAQPRVLENGRHIEKAAVQFSHSIGNALPPAATARNPELAGRGFQASAISVIVHPLNPHVPTTHMNLRFFMIEALTPVWYFGGGFDLTPCYGYEEDAVHWHQQAARATGAHYAIFKEACDEYFYLPHRKECRGIGGLFFDDWTEGGFAESMDLVQRVGRGFRDAYLPIFERRKDQAFDAGQRDWQLHRRGRYAEFNLVCDRGTKYGLQSGRRVESVLASLPPLAAWHYARTPPPGSAEARLLTDFLPPRDWLGSS